MSFSIRRLWPALGAALALAPASAHHSYVMFNRAVTTVKPAVVSVWQMTNPHGKLWVYIYNDAGKPELWAFEAPGPAQLLSRGWDKYTVKPGDKVTVSFNPLRSGEHGGSLVNIQLADGKQLNTGGAPGGGPARPQPGAPGGPAFGSPQTGK